MEYSDLDSAYTKKTESNLTEVFSKLRENMEILDKLKEDISADRDTLIVMLEKLEH